MSAGGGVRHHGCVTPSPTGRSAVRVPRDGQRAIRERCPPSTLAANGTRLQAEAAVAACENRGSQNSRIPNAIPAATPAALNPGAGWWWWQLTSLTGAGAADRSAATAAATATRFGVAGAAALNAALRPARVDAGLADLDAGMPRG